MARVFTTKHGSVVGGTAFAFGPNCVLGTINEDRSSKSAHIAKVDFSLNDLRISDEESRSTLSLTQKLMLCFEDQNVVMKDRAKAVYSLDASANIDILSDELDFLHSHMNEQRESSMHLANMTMSKSIYEIYRVWEWLDRFEANSSDSKVSIQRAGVLQIFGIQDAHKLIDVKGKIDESYVSIHPDTGAPTYYSKNRAQIRKLCGWVNSVLLDSSNNSTASFSGVASFASNKSKQMSWGDMQSNRSESGMVDQNDLLEHIVENCMQYSFERAAVVALWHGDLNYAIFILQKAVEEFNKNKLHGRRESADLTSTVPQHPPMEVASSSVEKHENNQSDSQESRIDWDYPVTEGYMQLVLTVAMCFSGFYPPNDAANVKSNFGRDRSAWRLMCEEVIYHLRAVDRCASSYLSAGCSFLLANCSDSTVNQRPLMRYGNILDDTNLVFEDRISFASQYLNDEDLFSWMLQMKERCVKNGVLEGLLLTGLSQHGCDILQSFLDRTNDIQTAALIASRVLQSTESNSGKEDQVIHNRVVAWLHCYRSLLNKWELPMERAHLDIEIGQRLQKNRQSKTLKNPPPSGSGKSEVGAMGAKSRSSAPPQRIPVYESALHRTSKQLQHSFVKLKCNYCNTVLPLDDLPSSRTESLRSGKSVLNCCANCGKQLPRCYVCQLPMVSL
jgi:hypothetical protein